MRARPGGRARGLSRRPRGWEPERGSFTPARRGVRSPGPSPLGGLLMPEDTEEPAVEREPTPQAGPGGWRPGPLVARGACAEGEREKAEGWDPNPPIRIGSNTPSRVRVRAGEADLAPASSLKRDP